MAIPEASPPEGFLLATSELVEQAFTRASGAPLITGNAVRLLKDGGANYPDWIAAIRAARRTIFFENYIIEDDEVGKEIAAALSERARAGVKVRLVRDWLGSLGGASRRYWHALADAGVELRCFNPSRFGRHCRTRSGAWCTIWCSLVQISVTLGPRRSVKSIPSWRFGTP